MPVNSLQYVILYVKDVEASAAWYRDRLGLEVRVCDKEWAELGIGGTTLALHHADDVPSRHHSASAQLVFGAEDVRSTFGELKRRGVAVREPSVVCEVEGRLGLSAGFEDLDGNHLSVFGLVPKEEWSAASKAQV